MERSHGKLSARFPNGLSCNNAHCFSDLRSFTPGEVPAVALCTNTVLCLTCQHRSYLDSVYSSYINNLPGEFIINFLIPLHNQFPGHRVFDILCSYSAKDPLFKRLYNLSSFYKR